MVISPLRLMEPLHQSPATIRDKPAQPAKECRRGLQAGFPAQQNG